MRPRRWTQIAAAFAANPWFVYFGTRTIYQGKAKGICFPGFNCYACPLALYACPIGSLQHSFAINRPGRPPGTSFNIAPFLYVVGFVGLIGAAVGRLACGWVCPFGFLQDLLYKIPTPKLKLPSWARFGKYATLVFLVMLIPFLTGVHWFSRLCPAGALEGGIPLTILPPKNGLPAIGYFFWLKIAILVVFLCWMVVTKRVFCRTTCPLGAIWALLTPFSLYRMHVDNSRCSDCGECRAACPVDINIFENANSPECIRCLDCKRACPNNAVSSGFGRAMPFEDRSAAGD
jgi:polyferredoxin